ncbi:MAG: OmpA family protein [Bacteroidales bacterium]|nr:OmpA family protein [Bacteroidales bacterium]
MKRIALIICVVLCGTLAGFAQVERSTNPADTTRYLMSKLSQNWFVSAYGSANWWQGSDRLPAGNFTTLNGPSFGGGIAVGKWITHKTGFRLAYDINPGKSFIYGGHDNLTHIHFMYVDRDAPIKITQNVLHGDTPSIDTLSYYETAFMYHDAHFDVLIRPIDLIKGYYFDRFYTPVIVAGMGAAVVSEHPLVLQSIRKKEAVNYELSYNVGLMNIFRLNNYLDLNLEFMLQGQRWTIDSWTYEFNGTVVNGDEVVSIRPKKADHNYRASLGLIWYPGGKIYELPYMYKEVIKETERIIEHIHDTIPCEGVSTTIIGTDTISEFISYPLSIFFHLDKSELMSGRDRVNLQEIANVAKEKNLTVHLRGSCDSATATAEYNKGLAQRRCNTIMNILMEMGVPREQIELEPVGGVKELDPTKYDRRVLITLGKKINK